MKLFILFVPFILSASFCGEKVNLGDNVPFGWNNNGQYLNKKDKDGECKIFHENNKIRRMAKTINKKFLVQPDIDNIDYLKITYDSNHMILNSESSDKSLFKGMIESTLNKVLSIDAIKNNKDKYERYYSSCKSPSATCENTFERGFVK